MMSLIKHAEATFSQDYQAVSDHYNYEMERAFEEYNDDGDDSSEELHHMNLRRSKR